MKLVEVPYLFLIPLLPLLGAVYAGFFGAKLQRRYGKRAVHSVSVALPWIACLVSVLAFIELARSDPDVIVYQKLWTWFDVGSLNIDVAFAVDRLSAVMILVVTFVGSLIHVYSTGYMHDEPSYWRFFSYLNLFMFAMLVLVLGDSMLLAFVGWEGVGLCSYLLIGFWYKEAKNSVAGFKAFVVNRIGDAGFVLGVFLLFWGLGREAVITTPAVDAAQGPTLHGVVDQAQADARTSAALPERSLKFREMQQLVEARPEVTTRTWGSASILTIAALLLFVGAMGKSAQIPLYVWLPDAMAGPTPVSALIHAATMVTAGVYLVARMHFVFALSPVAMTVVTLVGALTAFFAATIGIFQHDIKKVLAYSTVSQLGFMFVAVGVGAYWVAIFHLMTHAFFKACLFLGSGSVILGCHHEQDMRRMGGLKKLMPMTAMTYLVSCFAIAGFPPFSGFFSKDEILWKAFDSGNLLLPGGGLIPWLLIAAAALCTSFYMFRSYYMTFSGEYRGASASGHDETHHHGHHGAIPQESPRSMTGVLAVLGALAAVGGFIGLPLLWGLPNWFEHWMEPVFHSTAHRIVSADYGHGVEWVLMISSVGIGFLGFGFARWLYRDAKNPLPALLLKSRSPLVQIVYRVVYNKYYVDEAYQATAVRGTILLARALAWFDTNLVDGIVNACGIVGRALGSLQGLIDRVFVDGLVNAVGDALIRAGRELRRVQNGRIQTYVYGAVFSSVLLLVLAYVVPW
jgi:NADH-quinone oxidoreductase subunit L